MRVVIDTNVLIAALTSPRGSGARVVKAWLDGSLELVTSAATLREVELVLDSPWLERLSSRSEVKRLLDRLRTGTVRVRGRRIRDIRLKDEGDRHLVETAVAGDAAFLVTADRELLRQRGYAGTEFVTPAELLRALRSSDRLTDRPQV